MGTLPISWLALVAKSQGEELRSCVGHAGVCRGGGHPPSPSSAIIPAPDIPPWWVSLGPVPNPPQSSGVAQHVGCLRILASHPSPLKEV